MSSNESIPARRVVPILYRVDEAAEALHLGRTAVYELIPCGALRTVKVGTRRFAPVDTVREYVASLTDGAA